MLLTANFGQTCSNQITTGPDALYICPKAPIKEEKFLHYEQIYFPPYKPTVLFLFTCMCRLMEN